MKNRIIYGKSRKQNTERCINEVNSFLKNGSGENLYILVPEQYSSYYEQLLVKKSIEAGSFQAEILTFKRLAHRVFTKNLCSRDKYVDNAGKSMLMYDVVDGEKSSMKAFYKAAAYPAFANEAVKMITEFKRYGLSAVDVSNAAKTADNKLLSTKLSELANLYTIYSLRLEVSGFWDAEDDLTELAIQLKSTIGIEKSIFWVDAFDGFTPAEMTVIKTLIEYSKAVSTVLCADLFNERDRSGIFKPVIETANQITEGAENLGLTTEKIKVNEIDPAFSGINIEIEHFAKNYFEYPERKYDEKPSSIQVFKAGSIYEEVERCAIEISNKVRAGEMRYGDICVVSGLYDEYSSYISAVFESYNIPVFMDEKRLISKHPASLFMLSLLDIYIEKYNFESVFSYLKSPYSGYNPEDISKLENYVLEFDIKGNKLWTSDDWIYVPYNSRDRSTPDEFNIIRKKLTSYLEPIFSKFKYGLSGDDFTKILYGFLIDNNVYEKIYNEAKIAENAGRLEYSDELKQSWNILMDIIDQIKTVTGDKKYTIGKFRDMLIIAFTQKKIGLIPPRTDVVFSGKLNKAFGINIKMLCILGTNDPGFPEGIMAEGLFSDKERNELKQVGFKIAPDTLSQVSDKQMDVYNLLNLPTKYLYASYSMRGEDGSDKRPSPFIDRVKQIFPGIDIKEAYFNDSNEYIITPMSGLFFTDVDKESELKKWYLDNGYEKFFNKIEDILTNLEYTQLISSILGDTLETSATSLESYASCPYKYFVSHILNAEERRVFSISPPDVGSILHDILKNLVNKFKDSNQEDYSLYLEEADKTFNEMPISNMFNRDERMKYLGRRIVSRAVDAYIIARKQIEQGDFKPVELEASFGKNKMLEAPGYEVGDSSVYLKGRIDRVDAAILKNGEYFRIIDYKSSHKETKLCRIKEGLDIQLPLYLMAYMNGTGTKPAGMYYFDASKKIVASDYNQSIAEIDEKLQKTTRLTGYTLADNEVISSMDREMSGSSKNIGVKQNLNGGYSGKLISNEDIHAMTEILRNHITKSTKLIYNGKYEVYPVRYEKIWACKYCNYKGVCGFDRKRPGCKYKVVNEVSDKNLEWFDSE